jgi:hypothetical protein
MNLGGLAARAHRLQGELTSIGLPPEEGCRSYKEPVLLFSFLRNTRGYLEKVTHQINGTYVAGCYDACSVMIRRLLETLIIEAYEHNKIDHKIKNSRGDFLMLRDLVSAALNEPSWNLGRETRKSLPKLKEIGDLSAHSRRHNVHRQEIDRIATDLRKAVQELVSLAGLK